MTDSKKAVSTPVVHTPLEVEEKKSSGKNAKTLNDLRVKELAQKKAAEVASTSDHHDNTVFSHGPSNRGK